MHDLNMVGLTFNDLFLHLWAAFTVTNSYQLVPGSFSVSPCILSCGSK